MNSSIGSFAKRHASLVASVVLASSIAGAGAALVAARIFTGTPNADAGDLVYVACQILPYGVVGAVLMARRPDLPFGWLLSLSAMALVAMLAIAGASIGALEHGHGGQLAVWGLTAGSLMFVPAAIEGIINVRFPTGSPTGRWGRLLDRAIVGGIVLAVVGGIVGDSTVRAIYPDGAPGGAERFLDGTTVVVVGNLAQVGVPIVILLGAIAGIGVVARYVRSDGVERLQLKWRAVGVVGALALFPFAVTETLPDAVADVAPLLFVATLVVPVLRYDLWAIDSIIRRSSAAMFESPASVVQSMVKAAGEMLHLPYVAVRRTDRVLASYGEPNTVVEVWPLGDEFDPDGELVASPRHGFVAFDETDRRVLHTVAQLVGGAVRAELLTVDLQAARQHLVTAREEERRRLRRDLHDGLGPLLTGLGLNLDAATVQLGRSDSKTSEYLGNAKHASAQVITSIRELVDGLRPPALDELGLAGALKLQIERLATDAGLDFDLQVPHDLSLPAAVEVAALRTAVEAVTNVARHSDARRVDVALVEEPGRLVLTVTDDGSGQSPWSPGTGLVGMRERAEELGGTLTAGPGPVGGRIHVAYPLGTRP